MMSELLSRLWKVFSFVVPRLITPTILFVLLVNTVSNEFLANFLVQLFGEKPKTELWTQVTAIFICGLYLFEFISIVLLYLIAEPFFVSDLVEGLERWLQEQFKMALPKIFDVFKRLETYFFVEVKDQGLTNDIHFLIVKPSDPLENELFAHHAFGAEFFFGNEKIFNLRSLTNLKGNLWWERRDEFQKEWWLKSLGIPAELADGFICLTCTAKFKTSEEASAQDINKLFDRAELRVERNGKPVLVEYQIIKKRLRDSE